jgi:hypothetical protein
LSKEDFGKAPEYLTKIKGDLQQQQEEDQRKQELEVLKSQPLRLLNENEKEEMVQGLKENWERVNQAYRGLPVAINTVSQKTR